MNTLKAQRMNPSNQQSLRKCESQLTFSASFFSSLWRWALGRFTHAKRHLLSHQFVLVVKEVAAGLSVQLLLTLAGRMNRRIFLGLGLMGVVAPLSACFYMVFDWRVDKVPGWYHDNYFHFFLLLAPYFFVLFCLIGVWFLFPYRSARAYGLIVPGGYTIGKLLWLTSVTSDLEFYAVVPISFIGIGALISVFLFVSFDWLAHNVFHREHAYIKRLETLYNGADLVDDAKFKSLFKQTMQEKQSFQKAH